MSKVKRPTFDRERALEGLRLARKVALHIAQSHEPESAPAASARQIMALVDDLAFLLLRNRETFRGQPSNMIRFG